MGYNHRIIIINKSFQQHEMQKAILTASWIP